MSTFVVPLVALPQRFPIELAGYPYICQCRWNGEAPAWTLDLVDGITNEVLFVGLDIVTGTDLLSQYRYLEIGGALVAYTKGETNAPPSETNLGIESKLYFVVTP
tara:strand:- start:1064 stop:1378 length:315 start_codon:yes stop_codon:yes gene_type:complete